MQGASIGLLLFIYALQSKSFNNVESVSVHWNLIEFKMRHKEEKHVHVIFYFTSRLFMPQLLMMMMMITTLHLVMFYLMIIMFSSEGYLCSRVKSSADAYSAGACCLLYMGLSQLFSQPMYVMTVEFRSEREEGERKRRWEMIRDVHCMQKHNAAIDYQ